VNFFKSLDVAICNVVHYAFEMEKEAWLKKRKDFILIEHILNRKWNRNWLENKKKYVPLIYSTHHRELRASDRNVYCLTE
jgi:hypothetical protein